MKTDLGRKLREIRERAIAKGLKLLSAEEILEEVRRRRTGEVMKKILLIVLCLALMGCGGKFVNGLSYVMNGMAKVTDYFCTFSAQQVADAIAAQKFVADNPAIANRMAQAVQVFADIQAKICVTLPQLQDALAAFDQAVAVAKGQLAVQGKQGLLKEVQVPPLTALRTLAAKK